jgi:hypothetical protein
MSDEPLDCRRMVSMSVPELGVTGPQMRCGAPIPRDHCPFSHDRFTGCPYRGSDE